MKHLRHSFLLAIFMALLSGWFVVELQADFSFVDANTYQSDRFSIQLPDNLRANEYRSDDGSHAFLFATGSGVEGFQVFTIHFIDSLTTQVIEQQYPYNTIDSVGLLVVGGEPAFTFVNDNNDLDGTFEVWFVHDGLLYQVLTYNSPDWLKDILTTWTFK